MNRTAKPIKSLDIPITDKAGNINDEVYSFYPGMEHKINMMKTQKLDHLRNVEARVYDTVQDFTIKRAP